MIDYKIIEAKPWHSRQMAAAIGEAQRERALSLGLDPRRELHKRVRGSFYARTALIDGRPVAMWGLMGSLLGLDAAVWFVLAPQIRHRFVTIARLARREIDSFPMNLYALCSFADERDPQAWRFLRFLGFERGTGDVPLPHHFAVRRENAA